MYLWVSQSDIISLRKRIRWLVEDKPRDLTKHEIVDLLDKFLGILLREGIKPDILDGAWKTEAVIAAENECELFTFKTYHEILQKEYGEEIGDDLARVFYIINPVLLIGASRAEISVRAETIMRLVELGLVIGSDNAMI